MNEVSFVKWAKDTMESMMHDPIPEGRCLNMSYFWLRNEAFSVGKGHVRAASELLLDREQLAHECIVARCCSPV